MKRKAKLKFMQHVVYDPAPGSINESGEKMRGTIVLFLGELPSAPGHCAVINNSGKVEWMHHTDSFRAATEQEV